MDKVSVTLSNGVVLDVDSALFRRIVVAGQSHLSTLARVEGSSFPQCDKDALKMISKMQHKDGSMI